MGRFVKAETREELAKIMFANFGNSPAEEFLKDELVRYVPQFLGWDEKEIKNFMDYQHDIYINGKIPHFGTPIASLNPAFIASSKPIIFSSKEMAIYTRASVKENGYRMQLHIGPEGVSAFTRQFTVYDLRMFPELLETLNTLPVMFGDVELINKKYPHLAGFNRVEIRISGTSLWPRKGQNKLSEERIKKYLSDRELFDENGKPEEDLEMTICFHGLFAISDPCMWNLSREIQAQNMISFCELPMSYDSIDFTLNLLEKFIKEKNINARVVLRKKVRSEKELQEFIKKNDEAEGVCIAQIAYPNDGSLTFNIGKAYKVKKYETFDMALMGLHLRNKADGLNPNNITGALLGLYDYSLGEFLSGLKVNLDPDGPQVKDDDKRKSLISLRRKISENAKGLIDEEAKLIRLFDVYIRQGEITLKYILNGKADSHIGFPLNDFISKIPKGKNLKNLFEAYRFDPDYFENSIKKPNASEKFISENVKIFKRLMIADREKMKKFLNYFSNISEIKTTSAKLVKPQFLMNMKKPIIIEARVFNIKWNLCPYPAGFHTWYGNSFHLTNAFAERIRFDKSTTTDYKTVYEIARAYTVKKKRK